MANCKVSIIVPVYNVENYIRRCVNSLANQTYREVEIILVDDGSKDKSGIICDELSLLDERIKVIHKGNGGLVSAWKCGVKESAGQYLCFVDSDDWVDPTMIEEMSQYLTGNDKEMVISDYIIERDNGNREYVFQQLAPGVYNRPMMQKEVIPKLLGQEHRAITISRCMKLISTRLIKDNCRYSDERIVMAEDMTIMIPAIMDCERLAVMDHKAYYHYLYVQESMVHKYNRNLFENIKLLRKVIGQVLSDKCKQEELSERLKQLDQEYIFLLMLVLKNESRGNPTGYRSNILSLCKSEEVRTLVKSTPVTVKQAANKLLYLVMKHPNLFTVTLLRMAMIWYYRK